MRYRWFTLAITIAALTFLGPRSLNAQNIQSTILGVVTDSAGASVPNAAITVRNEGTNFERAVKTDENGSYSVAGLETGFYRVTAAAVGFKSYTQTQIDLSSSQIKRIDMNLQVGDVSTVVTVEGGTSQVETETATLSNLKTSRDFAELPMSVFGRAWANITNVTAGIQSTNGFEVNGARDTANNFTADGISVNDMVSSRNTANGFSGDIEAFQEIKILTANTSAEYAQVAQFMAVSKSGANTPHGGFYWGNFNSATQARSWADRQPVSFTNHNMFAGSGGGPIVIPKIYDGKNRTFFFGSYSGARYRIGNRTFSIVPTAAMRQGNFSALNGLITIVDPLNNRTPFPNNTIPSSRISPVSQKVQNLLYPDPNQPGQGIYGMTQNFYGDPGGAYDSNVYSIRVDHKISNNNLLFVRFGRTATNGDTYPGQLKEGYGSSTLGNIPGISTVVSDTHTFSATLVNEFKLGFNRTYSATTDYNFGKDVQSQLGINGIDNPGNDPAISGMPLFTFGGAIPIAASNNRNQSATAQNTYQIIDNASWFRGRHNIKFGVDIRRLQVNNLNKPLTIRGSYTFDDRLSGLAYANFLLGYPSGSTRGIARPNAYTRSTFSGFYIQDDFRVHPRLTLNYGLRYEYQTPWVEKFDRMFTFEPSTGSMVTAGDTIPKDLVPAVAATLPIRTAAQAGLPLRSLMYNDGNNFSPRLGLAYRPLGDASTVIRAGYGMYAQFWPGLLGQNATGGPWQSTENFILENANDPTIQFPNPFATTSTFTGIQSISGLSANFPAERTHQWNFSVGRQILGMAVDIGYVGTRSLRIPYNEDLNLLRPSTIPFSTARRPYPRYSNANLIQTGGSSSYHGLTIQADRRMSRGLLFNLNYTWAKGLTDTGLNGYTASIQQNQYARSLERSDDPAIRRQQFRFSYVWDVPVGRGRKVFSDMPRALDSVIGGWQLAGITTLLTGARLSPAYSNADPANTNQFSGRPDRIGDGNYDSGEMRSSIKSGKPIFNVADFRLPATGRGFYGNSARYILTGPGAATWNMGIHKNWRVFAERAQVQFRWEMHNAFNRANFNNPDLNIQSGSFGLVTSAGAGRAMLFGARLDFLIGAMRTLFVLALAAAAWAQRAPSGARHNAVERYELFKKNLALRGAAISRDQFQSIHNLDDWNRRRPEIRRQFLDMLGLDPLPPRTPLNARVTGSFERPGYRVENIVFESRPKLYVTGNLYLPSKPRTGPFPPIVYVSGHAPGLAGAKAQYQHHGVWLARNGFVAFVLDTIEFGEIPGIHHGVHDLAMWHWLSLGYTPAAVEVWNAIRALDYLETRTEVDVTRAGITGRSGGGAVSWFTAAADDRFKVSAPVHGTWSVGPHVAGDTVRENCDCIYFWNTYQFDLPLVGALIAPRPLMIVNASKDGAFPPAGYEPVEQCLRPVYGWYSAPERLAAFAQETGHQDTPAYRKAADEWLNRWLRKDETPYDEGVIERETDARLTVLDRYPADAINEGVDRTFIPAYKLQDYKSLPAWNQRRRELAKALSEKVFRAFPKNRVPFDTWKGKLGGWTQKYADSFNVEFTTEESVRVQGQLFIPRNGKTSHPALIYVKGKDDLVFSVDYDLLLSAFADHVVLVLNPRAVDYPMDVNRTASTKMEAALLGGTLESMQLWDILRSVDYLIDEEKLNLSAISVYGRKQMGGLAIHAAARDSRISRVILDDPPSSHWQGPALLNILRITDLPEVAGMIAPREIVSITPMPEAYRYTRSIYSLFGKLDSMRQAASLGEALRVWEH